MVNGTVVQVAPLSREACRVRMSYIGSVSYHRSKLRRARSVRSVTGTVSVAVVLSFIPENQAVCPCAGRTGMERATSWETVRRSGLVGPQARVGWTPLL